MSDSDSEDDGLSLTQRMAMLQKQQVAAAAPKAPPEAPKPVVPKQEPKPAPKPASKPAAKPAADSSDEDEPLHKRKASPAKEPLPKKPKTESKPVKEERSSSSAPAAKKPKPEPAANGSSNGKSKKKVIDDDEDGGDDDSSEDEGPAPLTGEKKAWYEDDDDEVSWKRGDQKWTTLEHNGVLFPPLYEPHGVKFLYDREVVVLTPEQEEVATMYAAMIHTDYATKEIFRKNFMLSWRPLLKKTEEGKKVRDLSKCDFAAIVDHLERQSQAKKELSSEQKKKIKEERDKAEASFTHAVVDGTKERLGNFRVEPPGLFRGRGEHPKMGQLKARIYPEDVTLNLGKKAKVPEVPDIGDGKKHKWGGVEHKNTVTWLAKWKDSINGEDKCVWLAANSSWKGKSDKAKYEKARELKQHIEKVRSDYHKGFRSDDKATRQKSVAVYLIDRLALRVGNEKNTDEEADTVGCCSLRVEHVKMQEEDGTERENHLHLNFLGKDSIVYDNTTEILPEVYTLVKKFMKNKKPADELFDLVQPEDLNDYFKSVMPGLSAKVFRTYNASITLDIELQKTSDQVTAAQIEKEGHVNALYNYYQIANKNVAELCNHQRATPASHGAALAKMDEKIEKVQKELKEAKKAKSSKVDNLSARLAKMQAERRTKDETKNVSLGTSKINYNDPRITIAWCKRFEVPISKPFPKTLVSKFAWAMGVEPEYRF